jgi:hypothetical protein
MFLLTVPTGETQGSCRINGREAEYKLLDNPQHGKYIVWRYADPNESRHWDRRNVLSSEDITDGNDVECTSFMCDDGQAPGKDRPPYIIVKPGANGEIVTETHSRTNFADLLPVQDNYYVLAEGDRLAKFGPDAENVGVLVFADLERAKQFSESVAVGSEFKPKIMSADSTCNLIEAGQTICVVDEIGGVTLATINGYKEGGGE